MIPIMGVGALARVAHNHENFCATGCICGNRADGLWTQKHTLMKWGNSADCLCTDFKWYLIAGSVRMVELFITALKFFLFAFLCSQLEGLPGTGLQTRCCQEATFSRTRAKKKTAWVTEQFTFFLLFLQETPWLSLFYANVMTKDTVVLGKILKRQVMYLKSPNQALVCAAQKTQLSMTQRFSTLFLI